MLLSEGEKAWIQEGFECNVRNDGRKCLDLRTAVVEVGLISSASGSARVRLGGNDVIVGVKVEVGVPNAETPDCGRVYFGAECSPCASPQFMGRGGDDLSSELAHALERSMTAGPSGCGCGVDVTKLIIVPGKQCWLLYVDALVLSIDGHVLDTVSMAVKAALADTKVPAVEVLYGEGGEGEPELELDDDPAACMRLDTTSVPTILTLSEVGRAYVVDMTAEEAACSSGCLQVAVTRSGSLTGVTQRGNLALDPGSLQELLEAAQKLGPQVCGVLDSFVVKQVAERT